MSTENIATNGGHGGLQPSKIREMQDAEDAMIQAASAPSLATLFQRGKDAGLIKPGKEYGNSV